MLKIESYITPYLLAYFDKYIKDFNPVDFRVSLWGGGASFTNLHLNLDVLNNEFNLPVKLISGYIKMLNIQIPWTKLTSEPIVIDINTIEVTLKMRSLSSLLATREESRDIEPVSQDVPPSYAQNLISKIIANVRVRLENVIIKYVDEDIVLSLNIRSFSLSTMNSNWEPSFVDLADTDLFLRRKVEFFDFTICLDQFDAPGKIAYQEPLLYRCSFEIRILQKFINAFARGACYSKMDFHFSNLKFSISEEQIIMLFRLHQLMTMASSIQSSHTELVGLSELPNILSEEEKEESTAGEEVTSLPITSPSNASTSPQEVTWTAWVLSLMPSSPYSMFGASDSQEEIAEPTLSKSAPCVTSTIGIYVDDVSFMIKKLVNHQGTPPPLLKSKRSLFSPYVNLALQGIVIDFASKGNEQDVFCGLSLMTVQSFSGPEKCFLWKYRNYETYYFKVGNRNNNYLSNSLFVLTANEVYDKSHSQNEKDSFISTDEDILEKTPAGGFCLKKSQSVVTEFTESNLIKNSSSVRLVIGPISFTISKCFLENLDYFNSLYYKFKQISFVSSQALSSGFDLLQKEALSSNSNSSIFKTLAEEHNTLQVSIYRPEIMLCDSAQVDDEKILSMFDTSSKSFVEAKFKLSLDSAHLTIQSFRNEKSDFLMQLERAIVLASMNTIVIQSSFGERSHLLVLPFSLRVRGYCQWQTSFVASTIGAQLLLDPVTVNIGPENLLCVLLLKKMLSDLVETGNEGTEAEVENLNEEPSVCVYHYDDLRSGEFKHVKVNKAREFPETNQIAICEAQGTMTWRYPEQRTLTMVESSPIPLEGSVLSHTWEAKTLDCYVEFWDEVSHKFSFFGQLSLSDSGVSKVKCPACDIRHHFVSTIWRVRIVTPITESTNADLITPDLFAASLSVNSLTDSSIIPSFIFQVESPRISIQFQEHHLTENKESYFHSASNEQLFASLSFEMNAAKLKKWRNKVTANFGSTIKFNVVDPSYLTMTSVVDSVLLEGSFCLNPHKRQLDCEFLPSELIFRIGASSLHVINRSVKNWFNLLTIFSDDYPRDKLYYHEAVNSIFVHNMLKKEIGILQINSSQSFRISPGNKVPFFWSSKNWDAKCKIGIFTNEWLWSEEVDINKPMYYAVSISSFAIFLRVTKTSKCQKLVTIFGSFDVLNATDMPIELSGTYKSTGEDITWSVPSVSNSFSKLIHLADFLHFRVRCSGTSNLPWSSFLTRNDMKSGHVLATIYQQDGEGIKCIQVWCSFISEAVGGHVRSLVVISPCYKILSMMDRQLICNVSQYRRNFKDTRESYEQLIPGQGSLMTFRVIGNLLEPHFISFKTNVNFPYTNEFVLDNSINIVCHPEIDFIMTSVLQKKNMIEEENEKWPYVFDCDSIPLATSANTEASVTVTFASWIYGLPTKLIEIKPSLQIINVCGIELYFNAEVLNLYKKSNENADPIPHASTYSSGIFKEGFQIGAKLNRNIVWTSRLDFTYERSKADVHFVNEDSSVPVNAFSRLEINNNNEIAYLTIETKMTKGILFVVVRSTYTFCNQSSRTLFVQGISGIEAKEQLKSFWTDAELKPFYKCLSSQGDIEYAVPMPVFKFIKIKTSESAYNHKYLALSCGGPWWFVQLIKFECIFDYVNLTKGIPGEGISVSLPEHCVSTHNDRAERKALSFGDYPVVLTWTSVDGRVFFCCAEDESYELTIENHSSKALYIARARNDLKEPFDEAKWFPQYAYLPPFYKMRYTFPERYAKFPDLEKKEYFTRSLLVSVVSKGSKLENPLLVNTGDLVMKYGLENPRLVGAGDVEVEYGPEKPLLVGYGDDESEYGLESEFLEDSEDTVMEYGLDSELSSGPGGDAAVNWPFIKTTFSEEEGKERFFQKEDFEEHGFPRGTLIVNEKLAWDHKIILDNNSTYQEFQSEGCQAVSNGLVLDFFILDGDDQTVVKITNTGFQDASHEKFNGSDGCSWPSCSVAPKKFQILVHLPLLQIILTDDFEINYGMREFFVLTLEGFTSSLNIDLNNKTEKDLCYCLEGSLADIQIESDEVDPNKRCDFPVILKQEKEFEKINVTRKPDNLILRDVIIEASLLNEKMMQWCIKFDKDVSVKHFYFKSNPLCLNIEDRLIDELFSKVLNVFTDIDVQDEWKDTRDSVANYVNLKSGTAIHSDSPACSRNSSTEKEDPTKDMGEDISSCHLPFISPEILKTGAVTMMPYLVGKRELLLLWPAVTKEPLTAHVSHILRSFDKPFLISEIHIEPMKVVLTMRVFRKLYLAFDSTPLFLKEFKAQDICTTSFVLGEAIGSHYATSALLGSVNPVNIIGSLELIGSPGTFGRSVGAGVKNLVVFPYLGLSHGPSGFLSGLNDGILSLVRNLTSGTLTSFTNWAWSVSRNIDRLTMDEDELRASEIRRRNLSGATDAFKHGLSGLGIRLLGALSGLAYYPIKNVVEDGPSFRNVVGGMFRGVFGVVTKPIGGAVEFMAMAGEGVLRGAGWVPIDKMKRKQVIHEFSGCPNSLARHQMKLYQNTKVTDDKVIISVDAMEQFTDGSLKSACIILSTAQIYIFSSHEDSVVQIFPVEAIFSVPNNDRTLICLKFALRNENQLASAESLTFPNSKNNTAPFQVASAESLPSVEYHGTTTQEVSIHSASLVEDQSNPIKYWYFLVNSSTKMQFIAALNWVKSSNLL